MKTTNEWKRAFIQAGLKINRERIRMQGMGTQHGDMTALGLSEAFVIMCINKPPPKKKTGKGKR